MNSRRRDGVLVTTYDGQGRVIDWLYGSGLGRVVLWILIRPWVSRMVGWFLDRPVSRHLVGPFVQKNRLDLSDYPERAYRSFNDFFTRTIRPECRPMDMDPRHLIAPCDGKLTALPIWPGSRFVVKGVSYTLEELLRDDALARRYREGTMLLFRLTVDDYQRYCYPADGKPGREIRVPGVYHTVNPRAAAARPIYRENTREYVSIETYCFGTLLMMEVGALLVGRIQNHTPGDMVRRGEEKGLFEFGGSTVIVLLEKGFAQIDPDILKNSGAGEETLVKMGERIGAVQEPAGPVV